MPLALSLIVLIVGLLMYALATNPKIQEIGRIMFAFGLLALLLGADKVVSLIRG
jgi:Na+/phosphate symporter